MKKLNTKNMPLLSNEEESIIQAIADKLSEQINQAVAASLIELFSILKENRTKPADLPRPDEFLTAGDIAGILKVSKGLAYRMIQTNEIASFSIGKLCESGGRIWMSLFSHIRFDNTCNNLEKTRVHI